MISRNFPLVKRFTIEIILAAFCIAATLANGQTPIVHYTFNETGTAAQSTGLVTTSARLLDASGSAADLHTASGLGVSGLAGDMAFDNTASTGMGNAGIGGVALIPPHTLPLMDSFTIQGWVEVGTEINGSARLLGSNVLSIECLGGALLLHLPAGNVTSAAGYTQVGNWMFIAVTYDGTKTSNNVIFYVGSKTSGVVQVGGVLTENQGVVDMSGDPLGIGNDSSITNTRPLDGYIDEVRIYASATDNSGVLTQAQLEAVRSQDVLYPFLSVPVVSSSMSVTGTEGFPFSYSIQAQNTPTTYTATGLPVGLGADASTGLISGTPGETGSFSATVTAGNLAGTGTGTLSLIVVTPPPPVITSGLSVTGTNGTALVIRSRAAIIPAVLRRVIRLISRRD